MSAASNYTEANVINALLRGVTFPVPTTVYVISLHTANPGETGGSEVSTTNWPAYVRKDAAVGGAINTGWAAPTDGVTTNSKQIVYPGQNGAANMTVSHWRSTTLQRAATCLPTALCKLHAPCNPAMSARHRRLTVTMS